MKNKNFKTCAEPIRFAQGKLRERILLFLPFAFSILSFAFAGEPRTVVYKPLAIASMPPEFVSAPAAPPTEYSAFQVFAKAFNGSNALNVAVVSPGSATTPTNTEQILNAVFNGSNALNVICLSGCGGGGGTPGGSNGQVQYNNSGAFGGFTMAGDCTLSVPNLTCTKTNGTSFAAVATSGSASDLGSGTLAAARLPSSVPTSVTNDTNVTGSISGNVLTLGWTGTAAKGRLPGTVVYTDQVNTYTAGKKQTFASNGTSAAWNDVGVSSDPSTLAAGDVWFRTDLNHFKLYDGSTKHTQMYQDDSVACSQMPALTGDATTSAGACATAVKALNGTNFVSGNNVPANSFFGNGSGSAGNASFTQPSCGNLSNAGNGCSNATQSANTFLAGPTSGSAAAPTYRAQVWADVPAPTILMSQTAIASSTSVPSTANVYNIIGVIPPTTAAFTPGHIVVSVLTADGTNNSAFGFATGTSGGTCTVQVATSAATYGTTGFKVVATTGTIPSSTATNFRLYFIWTSAAGTIALGGEGASYPSFADRVTAGTTSGGSLGTVGTTTFTCPADAWSISNGLAWFTATAN